MRTWSVVVLLVLVGVLPVLAAPRERNAAREAAVINRLMAVAPNAVPTLQAANTAYDRGDMQAAADLYGRVLQSAPTFTPAMRRAGASLVLQGKRAEGLPLLERAVELERSRENLLALAQCLVAQADGRTFRPSPAETRRALSLAQEALVLATGQGDPTSAIIVAELSLTQGDVAAAREALDILARDFPAHPQTHLQLGRRAMLQRQPLLAHREFRQAARLGASPQTLERYGAPAAARASALAHVGGVSRWVVGILGTVWVAGLLALFAVGSYLSAATRRALAAGPDGPSPVLRARYRAVLRAASTCYLTSMPVLYVLLVAAVGAGGYAAYSAWHLPATATLVVMAALAASIILSSGSLFRRTPTEWPGRPLSEIEASGLWALTADVAEAVDAPPVERIRVTRDAALAVCERGSYRMRVDGTAQSVLMLGILALEGLRIEPFSALLAREYARDIPEDGAGGDRALRAGRAMARKLDGMAHTGADGWWNPGYWYVVGFHAAITHIAAGAVQLQEMLAERTAVRVYGQAALDEGVAHLRERATAGPVEMPEPTAGEGTVWSLITNREAVLAGLAPASEPAEPHADEVHAQGETS